ncbi:MAG: signal peptidase II [Alphaproteobacteria bacterium]|jgi:signal peptidase II|nr:signal peptidase II [Alphaproteobacteria bacterium]MDP6238253.1 signal peptidase II [Alphaproteobacteria bacterium]MDP7172480.1 signal peptidase II [Alphaproteobacteria bacterium]MDP7233768.1 signal peptidase II [Alphaproteobacteria bacterium]HJN20819.1 signal peptidase II [Alphaproteobacteria bacterium]|tara:strand:+ start:1577 stop:2068 length:492 start_codon:yes stop_codon:yes gene_type:complete
MSWRRAYLTLGLAFAFVVAVLDQISKLVTLGVLPEPGMFIAVTGFFNLVHVQNTGVSFGLFQSVPVWLIATIALAIAAGLCIWMARAESRLVAVSLGLAVGGAIGNVIDRVRLGWVFDFLDFHALGEHWPAFNVADSAITLGVIGLLATSLIPRLGNGKLSGS